MKNRALYPKYLISKSPFDSIKDEKGDLSSLIQGIGRKEIESTLNPIGLKMLIDKRTDGPTDRWTDGRTDIEIGFMRSSPERWPKKGIELEPMRWILMGDIFYYWIHYIDSSLNPWAKHIHFQLWRLLVARLKDGWISEVLSILSLPRNNSLLSPRLPFHSLRIRRYRTYSRNPIFFLCYTNCRTFHDRLFIVKTLIIFPRILSPTGL